MTNRDRNDFARIDPMSVAAYDDAPASFASPGAEQELFERALAAAHLASVRGMSVSPETVASMDRGLPLAQVRSLWRMRRFEQALHERGILADDTLSGEQVAALVSFADTSQMLTERQKLRLLGISYTQFKGWLSNPEFARAYADVNSHSLHEAAVRGDTKLAEMVEAGNLKAIQYVNELTGKYRPNTLDGLDSTQLLASLITILTKRVKDTELLTTLSKDLEALAGVDTLQIAAPVYDEDDEQPLVAPTEDPGAAA